MMEVDTSFSQMDSGGGAIFSHNVGKIEHLTANHPQQPSAKRSPAPRCSLAFSNFVGRTMELERLSQFFFGEDVMDDQPRILTVIGIGGCGKTQLVRKFMEHVYR